MIALGPTRIAAGSEGVRVAWLGSRFFRYGDIRSVKSSGADVVLVLSSGRMIRLPIGLKSILPWASHPKRDALLHVLRERLAARGRVVGGNLGAN